MAGKGGQHLATLHDLLDDEGIELHEIPRPGGKDHGGPRSKLLCPDCGGGRSREHNFFVAIDPDSKGFKWFCHRASCGVTGGRRLPGAAELKRAPRFKVYRRPEPPQSIDRPDSLVSYFAKLGISAATLATFGIYRTTRHMPLLSKEGKELDGRRERSVIAYPYREDGALLNAKYKAIYASGAKRFSQEADAEPSLYNIDAFVDDAVGIIVEGEDDVLACWEAGFRQVTTLPDGSPSKLAESYDPLTDDDLRYLPLRGNARIARLKQIILAGDMDEAGRRHHEEIARRVGKARCWVVRWPDGCKDAKATLISRGREAVRWAIEHAEPYPLEGVKRIEEAAIARIYDGLQDQRFITGHHEIDQRVSLTERGQVIVTTGIPGHGKSAFWIGMAMLYTERCIELMKADAYTRPFHTVVFSAEMDADRVAIDLISQQAHKPFFPNAKVPRISKPEALEISLPWVRKHFSFIEPEDPTLPPKITWLLGRIREVVMRTGALLAVIDPWQELDDEMPDSWRQTTSRWILRCLQKIRGLAFELKINIAVVTHPKMTIRNKDGTTAIPDGYSIMDSQAFFSVAHIGLTIHRPGIEQSDMLIRTWKGKEGRFVRLGDSVVRFDETTTRIWPKPIDVAMYGQASQHWQDEHG